MTLHSFELPALPLLLCVIPVLFFVALRRDAIGHEGTNSSNIWSAFTNSRLDRIHWIITALSSTLRSPWFASAKLQSMTCSKCRPRICGVCQRTIRYVYNRRFDPHLFYHFLVFSPVCIRNWNTDEVLFLSSPQLAATPLGRRRFRWENRWLCAGKNGRRRPPTPSR